MLGEAFLLYNITQQAVSYLGASYRDALVKEKNIAQGEYQCKRKLKKASEACDLNKGKTTDMACIEMTFDTKREPLGIILGESVLLTTPEIDYIGAVDDIGFWDTDKTVAVLRHIQKQQISRKILSRI